ncbi:ATP-dependent RNA helicase DBP3 [Psilocybe cubensis]|uniref:ATP-dependent RNA helicase DBP3 n=2 Tax=Psilocybe cubensis TaxID=181762 RepID=A0ACB8HI18_PSICU|nr:ATP-dependent RNA helicase DBP3 [Psilocybe cubensis]KAH9487166.1 ATP-dependent RNA helicase DBP3 [Psilocybe cubensis]
MSRDTQPLKVKKSKKSDAEPIDAVDAAEQPTAEDSVKDVEKKKKKKSKRSKDESASEETAMVVDTEETQAESTEKEKKKKKKSKKADADVQQNVEGDAMDVDAEPKEKKKKKKKSSEEVAEETPVVSEDSEKKKKRKRDEKDAAASTSESKEDKKKRKKQKKEESSTPAESSTPNVPSTSASTSSAPAPSSAETAAFLEKHSVTITCPPGVPAVVPVISFAQLNVPAELQTSFKGFKEPTPIQACTWPPALEGRDVVGIAETGSGKTLAFGIPALNHLISSKTKNSTASGKSTVSILVVAPTRELADQTHSTLSALGKPFGIASVAVFGGVPKDAQVKMLKNANKVKDGLTTRIIVGTPGRILDLMQDGACDLSQVNYLVLDEADRMLDKGFENDIRNIIAATKPSAERQTMMFSATWPEAVRRLASTFQRDPVRVTVGSDDLTANSRVEQIVEVFDDARSKDQRLLSHLKNLAHKKTTTTGASESRILVFALYKKEASRVEQMLRRQGYSVGALHGDMSQNARTESLENFKNGTTGLLVATDVAARGLDIPNVGAVINYTFPLTIEDYIHRIGRTGRGGKTGKSITFFTGEGHERALAGEYARVLREGGFDNSQLQARFPMTIKKKEHSAYGAFFRDDIPVPKGPTKITF